MDFFTQLSIVIFVIILVFVFLISYRRLLNYFNEEPAETGMKPKKSTKKPHKKRISRGEYNATTENATKNR